ncbi:MAG: ABC transporter permease [Anaerolineaceae bacterium]|nr:ABC transporter permease [Anaerolineaceae bacterium]
MIGMVWCIFRRRTFRQGLLLLAVLMVSAAFGLFLSASETTTVEVNQDLAQSWRTTYDILVRPAGSRSPIEEKYGLVQTDFLSGIAGGINFDQWESIRQIPGIEVAAPIAMLDYTSLTLMLNMGQPGSGASLLSCSVVEDNGAKSFQWGYEAYYYVGPGMPNALGDDQMNRCIWPGNQPVFCTVPVSMLMAAIDPEAEAALVGLDRAVTGNYLQSGPVTGALQEYPLQNQPVMVYKIPALINTTPYLSLSLAGKLDHLALPSRVLDFKDLLAQGGSAYLSGLPRQTGPQKSTSGEAAYSLITQQLVDKKAVQSIISNRTNSVPSPIQYREAPPPNPQVPGPVLEAVPSGSYSPPAMMCGGQAAEGQPEQFRFRERVPSRPFQPFTYDVKGAFDIEHLPLASGGLSEVPLETYFPPRSVLRFDEAGQPVASRSLRPTLTLQDYLESPPVILTTLEAARTLAGENSISAIRVRVSGIDRFSAETQTKIEAVASEIMRRTGLEVDVVVGSSPRPLLVHIPGTGYVEENWIQKGVSLTMQREVQRANLVLFAAMLGVCALLVFNTTITTVVGRVQEYGLLKALGWRTGSLTSLVLLEGAFIGLAGGLAGIGLAVGLGWLLGLTLPLEQILMILPLGVLLCLGGFVLPAWWAGRVPPTLAFQRGRRVTVRCIPGWSGIGGASLWRQPVRTLLSIGVIAAGAAMLSFLLNLLWGMRGYLALTLLGKYILVQVSWYHWGMVGVVVGIGVLAVTDTLLISVAERKREIGLLKAVGWRTRMVAGMFLKEGLALGLLGGVLGTLLGLVGYLALYRSIGWGLLWAAFAGLVLPALAGLVAAAYPGWVATHVSPAESMRSE